MMLQKNLGFDSYFEITWTYVSHEQICSKNWKMQTQIKQDNLSGPRITYNNYNNNKNNIKNNMDNNKNDHKNHK